MIIEDRGVVLTHRKFQESGKIVECFLENHGLIKGYMHSSSKLRTGFSIGNIVNVTWKARLDSQLGYITLENEKSISTFIGFDKLKTLALSSISAVMSSILQEREIYTQIYSRFIAFIEALDEDNNKFLKNYSLLEIELLNKAGFGLDLRRCTVTNSHENLVYISPKTGRAVCASVGKPYHSKLLALPLFLLNENAECSINDIYNALKITNHFLSKYIWHPYHSKEPIQRKHFREAILQTLAL